MIRATALVMSCALAGPLLAEGSTPAPFPEFEAKRVKPPTAGSTRRITVQIEEPEPAPVRNMDDQAEGEAAAVGAYGWFWDQISPEMTAASGGRLDQALLALNGDNRVAAPRLQLMQDIVQAQGVPILVSSVQTEVSPALILAVIAVESAGQPAAVSGAGAQGLMQLMPDTASRFGVADALVAGDNILGGSKYLRWLMDEFDGDPVLTLAGYNAGEGAVRQHGGVPPYPETRDYVPKVLAAYQVARGLCITPPELITDGCVFRSLN